MTRPASRATALFAATAVAGLSAGHAAAQVVIDDDFESGSAADYTVINTAGDGSADFGFDYVAAGIPLAPRSAPGAGMGLRLTANDTAGESDAITAFNNLVIGDVPGATLTVDVYLSVGATSGTTEYANIGLAGDGATANSVFLPVDGSGTFIAFTGDGGSASDYRYFVPGATTTNSEDPSYLAGSANGTAQLYQDLFPDGSPAAGSPGNLWTTLVAEYTGGGNITYSLDGVTIFDTSLAEAATVDNQLTSIEGRVSLGAADVFSSVATPFQSNFVVYDNLVVEIVPEPAAALGLLGLGAATLLRRRSA